MCAASPSQPPCLPTPVLPEPCGLCRFIRVAPSCITLAPDQARGTSPTSPGSTSPKLHLCSDWQLLLTPCSTSPLYLGQELGLKDPSGLQPLRDPSPEEQPSLGEVHQDVADNFPQVHPTDHLLIPGKERTRLDIRTGRDTGTGWGFQLCQVLSVQSLQQTQQHSPHPQAGDKGHVCVLLTIP